MPVHYGKDAQGAFAQWGESGKKYYYVESSVTSKAQAEVRAQRQAAAIYASGWRERSKAAG